MWRYGRSTFGGTCGGLGDVINYPVMDDDDDDEVASSEESYHRWQIDRTPKWWWRSSIRPGSGNMSEELVRRSEVFTALNLLVDQLRHTRRKFLVDGRSIEASACDIKIAAILEAISEVVKVARRG
jgi:hypothetical protein